MDQLARMNFCRFVKLLIINSLMKKKLMRFSNFLMKKQQTI